MPELVGALLKQSVYNVLLLLHMLFSLLEPVTLPLDVDNSTVMQDTVKDRRGNSEVCKDIVPLRKGFI